MQTSKITNSRKFPKFIKSHDIFSKFDEVKKIFPLIGLDNCSEKLSNIDYQLEAAHTLKNYLVKAFNYPYMYGSRARARAISQQLRRCKASEFVRNGQLNPVPTSLAEEIEDINRVYKDCKYDTYHLNMGYYSHKSYNVYNPLALSKTMRVVFSSDKMEGAYDIATMSMRGISSCQSWGGTYKRNLIGSIIDPFVGIIYLTNNVHLSKGTKMLRRALVRYVVNRANGKPALLLERIYPNSCEVDGSDEVNNAEIVAIFKNFLKTKTNGKLPIITSARGYSIPNSKIVRAMSSCGRFEDARDYCRSYRDSGISYSKSTKVNFPKIKAF